VSPLPPLAQILPVLAIFFRLALADSHEGEKGSGRSDSKLSSGRDLRFYRANAQNAAHN